MNEIWEVLGIAPTGDRRAIRAAYSAMAKQCHPEEDPQGFKLLHEAYQEAMAYAGKAVNAADFSGEGNVKGENRTAAKKEMLEKLPEYGDEIGKNTANVQPSLLDRLAQAEEEEILKSARSGALMLFSVILNDPKKFRRGEAWKAFFLSEDFLREQYQESFADGMFRILESFHTEDNYNLVQMPSGFLMELAIAYALVLDFRQSEEKAANFYAREVAASIWNMQKTQYSLPFGPLGKPENQVRLRSFADYFRLRDYQQRGLLTAKNQEDWKEFLHGGVVNHLYELKGRGRHEIYPESRSVCLLDLCTFWVKHEDVPACVLEYIYKDYGLRGAEHTSTRKLYEPLKQAILSRYPNIEEVLYGENGKAKMISEWYRQMMRIISDNELFFEESEETGERVKALFEREEWEKIRYLPELFKKIELQMFGRSVMPVSLAKRLMEYFSDEIGIQKQVWERETAQVMTEEMIHSLYYSRMLRDMRGDVPRVIPYFEKGKLREVYRAEENCSDGEKMVFCTDFYAGYPEVLYNQDFWHYFLMRGFGCRSVRITGREKYRRQYMIGMNASLPAYIKYLYQPSMRWQKLFTESFGERVESSLDNFLEDTSENFSDTEKIPMPKFCRFFADDEENIVPGAEFMLPDGKKFQAEFYLHYVRYFLDGKEIFYPVYDFNEYEKFAESISDIEQIFLLAITKISVKDYERAQGIIEHLLMSLSLAPVSIPVIAKLLILGEEDESAGGKISPGSYFSHISLEMAAESTRFRENKQEEKTVNFLRDSKGEGENLLCGVFYLENEELCFRAVVRESGFSIFRQTDFGWDEIYTDAFEQTEGEDTLSIEEKRCAVQDFLRGLTPPAPRLRIAFSLEGLTNEKKAERILEALKRDARYRGSVHGLLPYAPGYPWEEEDTGRGKFAKENAKKDKKTADTENVQGVLKEEKMEDTENALKQFYREYGGFLPECYCVLRFGKNDTQDKKDHVFYASMKPFGFSLAFRALDWPSSYEQREEELHRKVKEKHWAVGHFGWGDLFGPNGESLPKIVAVGESGTYYYYDIIRMLHQENLAALLARMFDFSNVVAVENYEGELSISRFSGELEYCYGRDEFLQSVYTEKKTAADLFTVFTKAEMMGEFAVFMDGLLEEITEEPENLYFEFSYVGDGAYAMRVFAQDIMRAEQTIRNFGESNVMGDDLAGEDLMQGRKPLVWKIWQQSGNGGEMSRDFKDTVYWYMECSKFGKKLVRLKKITAGFDLGEGDELVVCIRYGEKEGAEWHRNKMKEGYFEEEEFEEEFEGEFLEENWE